MPSVRAVRTAATAPASLRYGLPGQRRQRDDQPARRGDGAGDIGAGGREPHEDQRGMPAQPLARRGERHRPPGEQRDTEVGLQRRDVLRHRRLGEAQPLRRAAERAGVGDREEGAQQMGIHISDANEPSNHHRWT